MRKENDREGKIKPKERIGAGMERRLGRSWIRRSYIGRHYRQGTADIDGL